MTHTEHPLADRRRVRLRPATIGEIVALRHAELRAGLPRETAEFDGDDAPTTRHYGGFVDGDAVACASFMLAPRDDARAYQLRGMAIRGDLARRGIGAALLRFALGDVAGATAVTRFWCNARVPAVPFYRAMGWAVVSDVFDVPTAGPHRVMTFDARQSSSDQP